MTIAEAKKLITTTLQGKYDNREANAIAGLLIEHITGLSHTFQIIETNFLFSDKQKTELRDAVKKLTAFVPIDHIIGEKEFLNITLKVNYHVLIPRPETEELVEWIRESNDTKAKLNILDIGTGSGCIALALKESLTLSTVCGVDISDEALKVSKSNALYNNLDVNFVKTDILSNSIADEIDLKYDVIVSNPPYIRESEKKLMHDNVLKHEPNRALFVADNNALIFYEEIIKKCDALLKESGWLYFEINEAFGNEMISLFQRYGFRDVELKQDLFNKDRMIRGRKC
ncbi:MAG: peptide chain release factor N(5)-glutamine methyltransferase [Bacteroidota bacterium]|nr:peptide chain release factor N(5)-glutamine methyltransferase [Bacteroidota bacterium]